MNKYWIFIPIILGIFFSLYLASQAEDEEFMHRYQVHSPETYQYSNNSDKLLFVVDYSNSMGEYLEHKTKV